MPSNNLWNDLKMQVMMSNNVIIKLIAINVVLFVGIYLPISLLGLGGGELRESAFAWFRDWFWLPLDFGVFVTRPWTLITHYFLHSRSISHILFNMLFLLWFGNIFQNLMGNRKTLSLYLFAGLVCGVAMLLVTPILEQISPESSAVGASGAVMAIVLGAATLSPNYELRFLFVGNLKLWWIAAFYVLIDLLFLTDNNTGGHIAHLIGALIGYLYVVQLRKGTDIAGWTVNVVDFFAGAFKSKPKSQFKVHRTERRSSRTRSNRTTQSSAASEPFASVSQAEIDVILDKIAKSGYDSLSAREKDILFRASK